MDERQALLILNNCPGIGHVRIAQLCTHFGSATEALKAPASALTPLRLGKTATNSLLHWRDNDTWRRDLDAVERGGVRLISVEDAEYPSLLRGVHGAPRLLYVAGSLSAAQSNVAVIGTRVCSRYGTEMANRISQDLAANGYCIISGLARGIDTAAHTAAVEAGTTVAVLGCGLAHLYPQENRQLASQIATEGGAVISELPMATPPDRQHFPRRNRIVSGMSQATLLIEAPIKSGAMITMRYAREQGRQLFVLPGRADLSSFEGNHALLKSGEAQLITSAADILQAFGQQFTSHRVTTATQPAIDPDEQRILSFMTAEECHIDELANKLQVPVDKLNVLLMSLLLKNMITESPGKLYRKRAESLCSSA